MKILHLGPWGYNMTNNNFYEVIKETEKRATIRRIASRVVENAAGLYPDMKWPTQLVRFKLPTARTKTEGRFIGKKFLEFKREF